MYLVRTIQHHEDTAWVDQLGEDLECFIPLPMMPQQTFERVAVIHGDRMLEFELDRIEQRSGDEPVGASQDVIIRAKVAIYVKPGPLRIGRALIPGFQGIRYAERWEEIARDPYSSAS